MPLRRVAGPADAGLASGAARGTGWAWSMLPVVAAFTAGALALLQLPALPPRFWWVLALAAMLCLLLLPRLRHFSTLLLAFLAGAALTAWHASAVIDQRWPATRYGETLTVDGVIGSLPESTVDTRSGDNTGTRSWRFRFDTSMPGLPPQIRVGWYRSTEQLRGGECWRLLLSLRTPHGSANPGGFDYEGWLFRERIVATATVRSGERCTASGSSEIRHRLLRLRQAFADRITAWLPGHPALPMVLALTLGDTSGLEDEAWATFRLTGTTHLVAISGFNIAIVAGVVFFLLRWLWSRSTRLCLWLPAPRAAIVGSVLAALAYALLAGFEPPVQRAAMMLLILAVTGWLGGLGQPSRALALAWFLIVAAEPLSLLSPGLWLSFSAVAAIFYATGGRLSAPPAWRAALQVQLMLSLMLAPLTLFWFQGASLTGPLVNLLAVPAAAVITPALLAALLLTALAPAMGLPLLKLVADALALAQSGLFWIAEQTPQAWAAASPPSVALVLALIGAVLLFAPAGLPLRLLGALLFSAIALPPARSIDKGFRMTVLDVGQGLSVVVQTSGHALLFDTGPAYPGGFDAGRSVVVPFLLQAGVNKLDRLIVSHGDLDHRGGVDAVMAAMPVESRMGWGSDKPCVAGESWQWDEVRFELLSGPAAGLSDNNGSCVLRIEYADHAALLPGDIEALTEQRLVDEQPERLRADVLLAAHHGSRTSSSAAFITAVQPKLVIHSAGWHHHFGHPAFEVVSRFETLGSQQLASGDGGAIAIEFDAKGLGFESYRQAHPKLWQTPADEVWRHEKPKRAEE